MPETQNIEYKSIWKDEYLKWICGFANAQGGTLYIGKDDNGNVVGVKNAGKLLEELPNKITTILGIVAAINLHETPDGEFIEIEVEPHPNPVNYKGEYHLVTGKSSTIRKQHLKTGCRFTLSPQTGEICNRCIYQNRLLPYRQRFVVSGRNTWQSL